MMKKQGKSGKRMLAMTLLVLLTIGGVLYYIWIGTVSKVSGTVQSDVSAMQMDHLDRTYLAQTQNGISRYGQNTVQDEKETEARDGTNNRGTIVSCSADELGFEEIGIKTKPEKNPVQSSPSPAVSHVHTWVHHEAVTHTVHHDATFKTVHHDAVTEQKYIVDSPTVWKDTHHCECGSSFSSNAELIAHQDRYDIGLGHDRSWVTEEVVCDEIGHYETVIVKGAWDETVMDQAAWDETVMDVPAYDECSICGARQ